MAGSVSVGQSNFRIAYELSPIVLTGGIATNMPGGKLPILSLLQASSFSAGVLQGATLADAAQTDTDQFFAHFRPLPGADLIAQDIAHYPFANQAVAANATIQKPLRVGLRMIAPASSTVPFTMKLAIMTSVQNQLTAHNAAGGTYIVYTPSFFYTDCLLESLAQEGDDGNQSQVSWRWIFERPLLTLQSAQAAQNNLMGKLTAGTQIVGPPAYSGLGPTVNVPGSLAGTSLVPATGAQPPIAAPQASP